MSNFVINPYSFEGEAEPIAKDSQAYAVTSSNGDELTVDITVADNPNRILIVTAGSYNLSPTVDSITYGSQSLTQFNTQLQQSDGRCDLWYLNDPAVGTDTTITVTWSSTAGRKGVGAICFYNTDGLNASSSNTETSNTSATVEGNMTPTEDNSAIVDGMLWLTGTEPSLTLTAGFAVNISDPGGADRAIGMQYDLSPTKDALNEMEYTSAEAAGYAWCGAEIKNG